MWNKKKLIRLKIYKYDDFVNRLKFALSDNGEDSKPILFEIPTDFSASLIMMEENLFEISRTIKDRVILIVSIQYNKLRTILTLWKRNSSKILEQRRIRKFRYKNILRKILELGKKTETLEIK